MDIVALKEYIIDNGLICDILDSLDCHHISDKTNYYQCANPDGDNITAVTIYKNENLSVINYTRDLGNKKSFDIFDLIQFYNHLSFFEALKWLCNVIKIDYYKDWDENLPESLQITKLLLEMRNENSVEDFSEIPLRPISENILKYYYNYCNFLFQKDNIDFETQKEFEIGYDSISNRITIPIRDEIGTLCGVKGRLLKQEIEDNELKYIYLEPCGRSQILYGLYKTYNYIKKENKVYVCESEKGVMQLWCYGIKNSVATGGKKISNSQIEKLSRLCVDIVFAFDKDVKKEEIELFSKRFIDGIKIYYIFDTQNILEKKESPTDNFQKFNELSKKCLFRLK